MSYTKPLMCPKHNIERVYRTNSSRPSGKSLHCPLCSKEMQKSFTAKLTASGGHHEYNLHRYGITKRDYDRLLFEQSGLCAICGNPETATNQHGVKRLAVDHDWVTKQVRGLLCSQCNQMIGRAKDNPETLERGAVYLRKSRAV